jgi:hypothetical protein
MKNIFYLFALPIILVSCATPSPIIRLTPSTLQTKDYWNLGQQFVYSKDNNVWFDCAFNRYENGKLIFDVKVINESDTAVLVDPILFQQEVYKNDTLFITRYGADNPELVLFNLKVNENVAAANAKNATTLGICSLLIGGGAMIAVAASKKDADVKERVIDVIANATDIAIASTSATSDNEDARANDNWYQRKTLSELFLRKTTLPSGFFIDGEVHFPYNPIANWYRLIFVAGNSKADFLFKQSITYPSPNQTYNR